MKNIFLYFGKLLLLIIPFYGQALDDSRSLYVDCPKDPLAVYFSNEHFQIDLQGKEDVSDELQRAINKVQETTGHGILFIPEGVYHISKTIHIWKGIRLIGYGKKRPEFVIPSHASFGKHKYLFHFCFDRPKGQGKIKNADADTYYSGLQNINIRVANQESEIVAVKFNVAQHSILSHIDFYLNDNDNAIAVEDMPSATQIIITDKTPVYQGAGSPLPMIESPSGGNNIISGIGMATIGENPRVTALKWKAGTHSLVNDVRFFEETRTYYKKGTLPCFHKEPVLDTGNWQASYSNRFDKPFQSWNSQYWSLWVTDGGGGTFKNIWIPHTYACAGMYVSNTHTEGRTYMLSIEHHVRNEVIIDKVSNWDFFALQLEEQYPHGIHCLPLEIKDSRNILFANTYSYRVSRMVTPYP